MTPHLTPAQNKAMDMEQSMCVTAGAGTGKTFLLTKRYMQCLAAAGTAQDILAMTYTEKAAAEMQMKISAALKEKAETDPAAQEIWKTFSQCSISTFHGFCLSVLKEFAYEAGLDAGFTIMDELDRHELVSETIEEVLRDPPSELFEAVVHLYSHMGPETVRSTIDAVTGRFAEVEGWFEQLKTDPAPIYAVWQEAYETYLTENGVKTDTPECKAFLESVARGDTEDVYLGYLNSDKPAQKILKNPGLIPSPENPGMILTRTLLLDVYATAKECARKIARAKERRGLLDFDDLIRTMSVLLSSPEHADIQKILAGRYRYILVDEVQDNDPNLMKIVRRLCGDPKESNRLFIVGDAKQSIYLFRNADVAVFQEFLAEFPHKPVALDTSFRSVPEIVTVVNSLFREIFKRPVMKPWDAPYDEIQPSRQHESGGVEIISLPRESDDLNRTRLHEADALADWMYHSVCGGRVMVYDDDGTRRPARYGDCAVLIEKHAAMEYLRPAFERFEIPYAEEGGQNFYERQEVRDFYHLLYAVLYPTEDIPLYGVLRSAYFGVSDADLCRAAARRPGPLITRLNNAATAPLASALAQLKRWHMYALNKEPVQAVQAILLESQIFGVYGGMDSGREAKANLEKLLAILRSRCGTRAYSLYEFVSFLEDSMNSNIRETDGVPGETQDDRVRVMTVHASKGLEFPIVCVCFAGAGDRDAGETVLFDERLGVGLSIKNPGGLKFISEITKQKRDEMNEAEHRRLFYVAMTRARDFLVLCGSQETKKGFAAGSFMQMYEEVKDAVVPIAAAPPQQGPPNRNKAEPRQIRERGGCPAPLPEDAPADTRVPSRFEEEAMHKGSLMHEIFAGGNAVSAAKRAGLPECAERFERYYQEFLAGPLMKDAADSWCELEIAADSGSRVVDRLVRYMNGRYRVIDYKSGTVSSANRSGRMEEYRRQVSEYCRLAGAMLNQTVDGCLYFPEEEADARIVSVV